MLEVASYIFYNFLKYTHQSFFVIQWMYLLCIMNLVTSNKNNLIFCSRWLPRK